MTANGWERSIWRGTSFLRRGRPVYFDRARSIFACPRCEYVMVANDHDGARAIRRVHVATAHPRDRQTVEAIDALALENRSFWKATR